MATIRGCAHILFTRVPLPGTVKARLAPALSPSQRALLQEALIVDTAMKLLELDGTVVLCCSDEQQRVSDGQKLYEEFVKRVYDACAARSRMITTRQRGDNLGKRMSNALEDIFDEGADACLLIGSDLPYFSPSDIAAAEQLLESADIVFGPSPDGGYWLVGMKEPFPQLFEDDRYSRCDVLERALAICEGYGKTVAFGPSSQDIDTPKDCEFLLERVALGDERIGARTVQAVEFLLNCN